MKNLLSAITLLTVFLIAGTVNAQEQKQKAVKAETKQTDSRPKATPASMDKAKPAPKTGSKQAATPATRATPAPKSSRQTATPATRATPAQKSSGQPAKPAAPATRSKHAQESSSQGTVKPAKKEEVKPSKRVKENR